jgi:peptidoglycan hydrolase-like protein with peptidoglycan-binding domain
MALTSPRFANDPRLQAAAMNNPPMRRGETGDSVGTLQQALYDLGYPLPISFATGTPDGIYGAETEATVRQFQTDQGIGRDGVAGHDTLGALDALFPPPPPPGPPRVKGSCWRQYIPTRIV